MAVEKISYWEFTCDQCGSPNAPEDTETSDKENLLEAMSEIKNDGWRVDNVNHHYFYVCPTCVNKEYGT